MIAYLSGPMTGYPDDNRPAFRSAAKFLRERCGMTVVSPDELDEADRARSNSWADLLRRDLRHLSYAEACVVLPGWRSSRRATLEVLVLAQLGCPVLQYPDLRPLSVDDLPAPCHPVGVGVPNTDRLT